MTSLSPSLLNKKYMINTINKRKTVSLVYLFLVKMYVKYFLKIKGHREAICCFLFNYVTTTMGFPPKFPLSLSLFFLLYLFSRFNLHHCTTRCLHHHLSFFAPSSSPRRGPTQAATPPKRTPQLALLLF